MTERNDPDRIAELRAQLATGEWPNMNLAEHEELFPRTREEKIAAMVRAVQGAAEWIDDEEGADD